MSPTLLGDAIEAVLSKIGLDRETIETWLFRGPLGGGRECRPSKGGAVPMIRLNFRVETRPNGARVKIRDGTNDRLFGPCVADEAILWDAYQEAREELGKLIDENEALRAQLDAAPAKGRKR